MLRMIAVVALLLVSHAAHAQRAPDMATLDRGDGISKLGLDLGLTFLDVAPYEMALRAEISGQYVTQSGFGIYGALPFARSFGAADENEDPDPPDLLPNNASAVGNLDVGALFVATMSENLSFVFRGGLAVPIGSTGRDASATLLYSTFPRLTDIALANDAWYIRLGVSPLIYFDRLFFRFDIGFDIGIDDDDGFGDEDELFRINAGAGIDVGAVALSLELVNLATLDDFDNDERFLHTLGFTVRFMGETLQPFLAVGTPIDDSRRDVATVFISGGLQAVF